MTRQGKPNARLAPREVEAHCVPDAKGAALLAHAMTRLLLSARAYHRILKVARTIADLAGSASITAPHVAEAVAYRRFDRMSGGRKLIESQHTVALRRHSARRP
jgi:magnesium chelatase family protein